MQPVFVTRHVTPEPESEQPMPQHTAKPCLLLCLALLALALSGCGGLGLYDRSQVPVITAGKGLQPVFTWTPPEAYELHVYAGTDDGDGLGALWTAKMPGGYENTLISPVTYGVDPPGADLAPATPLEEGKSYTVVVVRKDPKGQSDGFTSTGHRYDGKLTFVASSE
jgi:hypothetical protein